MPDLDAHLATLVGSRLCHDLISPVGAIQNGLELLALSGGGATSPEMALISEGFSGNKAEGVDYIVGNIDGDYSKEEIETALAGANSDDETVIENRAVIAQWVVWQAATELTANFSEFLETQGNLANKSGGQ